MPTPWTQEADQILRDQLAAGATAESISQTLTARGYEKSRSSVIGRITRLGLRNEAGYSATAKRNKAQAFTFSKSGPRKKRPRLTRNPDLPPVEDTVSLKSNECRWIEDGKYCRAETVSVCSSWCHEHASLARP